MELRQAGGRQARHTPLPSHLLSLPLAGPRLAKGLPPRGGSGLQSVTLSAAAPLPRPPSFFLKCHQPPHPVTLHQLSRVGPGGTWLGDPESWGGGGVSQQGTLASESAVGLGRG